MRSAIILAGMVLCALLLTAPVLADNYAITGGTAYTHGGRGKVERATVLISDGKIVSVIPDGKVPDGYERIDARGKWITVGFMVSATSLGLGEIGISADINDARSEKAKHTLGLDPADGYNPDSTLIPVTRIEGVTRASVNLTGGKDMWLGQGMVVNLGRGTDTIDRHRAYIGLDISEHGARTGGGSRPAMWDAIRAKFDAADPRTGRSQRKKGAEPDADVEALRGLFTHKAFLLVVANRTSDIRKVMALKQRYGFDVIVAGGAEAWRVADDLARARIPVVLNPLQNLPRSFDELGATGANAARLARAGVKVAFLAPDTHNARLLPQSAGNAVAMGMRWTDAVDAISVNPAEIFGIADHYGTLEKGMDADVVIWNGDPLEVMTSPDAVFVKGQAIPMRSRQTALRDRYETLTRSPQYRRLQ